YYFHIIPRVGLVRTYDNTIESILKALKVSYRVLDSLDLGASAFDGLNVILLDLRAYFYREDLSRYNTNLLDYVQNGGNLICFYNKPSDWNGKNFSPYPIYLTLERVTEEDVPVKTLQPNHPFFNTPIKIIDQDWKNWIQERNIYLPSD